MNGMSHHLKTNDASEATLVANVLTGNRGAAGRIVALPHSTGPATRPVQLFHASLQIKGQYPGGYGVVS